MASSDAPTEDPFGGRSFVSPAKIRILLTPAGSNVSPTDFEKWAAAVRSFESIRLSDLPPSSNGRAGPAVGSALHRFGEVQISFVTSYDPSHAFLSPFALHRQVLGVLGLSSLSNTPDRAVLEKAPAALRELHPKAIVHKAFVFDTKAGKRSEDVTIPPDGSDDDHEGKKGVDGNHTTEPQTDEPSKGAAVSDKDGEARDEITEEESEVVAGFADTSHTGLVIFPAVRRDGKDVRFYLRTLLRELIGQLLDGLWDIVKGLEGKALETPRETLDGILATPANNTQQSQQQQQQQQQSPQSIASPTSSTSSAASRASSFFSSFGSSSSSSTGATSSAVGGGSQPAVLSPGSDPKSAVSKSSAARNPKRTTSMAGAGPTGAGRYAKIRADYSLLAGDLWGAIGGYDTCMSWLGKERALAGGQDAVWYGSALEGWAVARCLVFRMSGLEEKGPSLTLPAGGAPVKDKKDKTQSELTSFAKFEWGDVAEAYALALQIYGKTLAPPRYLLESARSVTSDTPRDYTHPLIHASACIAYSRLLLAVWASGGWNAECFDQLIYGGVPPSLVEDARPGPAMYASLSRQSSVERHEIAAPASLALSHSVSALKPPDQIAILCSLANVYGCVGFLRREAYLLRQLQATVVSLLARALLLNPREPKTVAKALSQVARSDHAILGTLVSQTLSSGLGQGSDAVLILALQICETYGINVDIEPLRNIPTNHILARAATTGKTTATGEPLLKRTGRAPWAAQNQSAGSGQDQILTQEESAFGWADLQVALLKDTICVAEMLQDHVGMAFFAAILLRDLHEVLSAEEQRSLIRGLTRCVHTARWHDARDLEVLYWGPAEPVCGIEVVPLPPARQATERPASYLSTVDPYGTAQNGSNGQGTAGLNNPFFWNPSGASASKSAGQGTIIENEQAEFLITLQNPFKTALDCSGVRLSTSGTSFDADSIEVVLPPEAYHTIRLTGRPRESGTIQVRGCFVTLAGCQEHEFTVLQYDVTAEKAKHSRDALVDDRRTRLKLQGLDARPAFIAQKRADEGGRSDEGAGKSNTSNIGRFVERFLQCKVLPSQPLLSIDSPSLLHGRFTLNEGELRTLRIRLTNRSSDLPIDFVRLILSDDLTASVRAALAEGDLLPEDAWQLESHIINQPGFAWDAKHPRDIKIAPGASIALSLRLRGKLDMTQATIDAEFAHVDAPGRGGLETEQTTAFWTRRATFSFSVNVKPVIELGQLSIRHMWASEAQRLISASSSEAASPAKFDASGSSLVSTLDMDLHNVHDRDVEFALTLDRQGNADVTQSDPSALWTIKQVIAPGKVTHLALPLPRLPLTNKQAQEPIPLLGSATRQFVLSQFQLTEEQELRSRERFWYKREIMRRLQGRWSFATQPSSMSLNKKAGGGGDLNSLFEEMVLTDEMVKRLQGQSIHLHCSIVAEHSDGLRRTDAAMLETSTNGEAVHVVPPESLQTVRTHIYSNSTRPLKLLHRLIPLPSSAIDDEEWDGDDWDRAAQQTSKRHSASGASGKSQAQQMPLAAAGHHSTDVVLGQILITDGGLSRPVLPWPLPAATSTSSDSINGGASHSPEVASSNNSELHANGNAFATTTTTTKPAATVDTGICFMAEGRFAFLSCVEEMIDDDDDDDEERAERAGAVDYSQQGDSDHHGTKVAEAQGRRERVTVVSERKLIVEVRRREL